MVSTAPSFPPTMTGHWFTAGVIPITRDFIGWLEKHQRELGNIFYAPLKKQGLVVLSEPAYVRYVLQENNRNYYKSFGYEILQLFLGNGLLTSDGDFWLRQRRLAQPAFHRRRLAGLVHFMSEETAGLAQNWKAAAQHGESIDLLHEMMEVTMKIVARALFSANVNHHIPTISHNLERLNNFAMTRIKSPIRPPMWMPTLRNLVFRQTSEEINDVLFQIIEDRRQDPNPPDDLLTMLMEVKDEETGEQMNNQQLRDECMTIFVAGHETTALGMTWLFTELARNPEVWDRLQAELKEVLDGRTPTLEDIPNLKYTRMVVDETLRLYPPGWIIGRKNIKEDHIGGYDIPEDTNVLMFTYGIHRRPDLWERPLDFWPGRWETEQVKQLPRMAYLPFGGGPRLCIGNNFALMEMVIMVAGLAQAARPQLLNEEEIELQPLITLRPKHTISVKLNPVG